MRKLGLLVFLLVVFVMLGAKCPWQKDKDKDTAGGSSGVPASGIIIVLKVPVDVKINYQSGPQQFTLLVLASESQGQPVRVDVPASAEYLIAKNAYGDFVRDTLYPPFVDGAVWEIW